MPADRSTDLRFAGRNVVGVRLSELDSSVLVEFLEAHHSSRDNVRLVRAWCSRFYFCLRMTHVCECYYTGTSQCVSCSIGSGCKEEVLMVMVVAG